MIVFDRIAWVGVCSSLLGRGFYSLPGESARWCRVTIQGGLQECSLRERAILAPWPMEGFEVAALNVGDVAADFGRDGSWEQWSRGAGAPADSGSSPSA